MGTPQATLLLYWRTASSVRRSTKGAELIDFRRRRGVDRARRRTVEPEVEHAVRGIRRQRPAFRGAQIDERQRAGPRAQPVGRQEPATCRWRADHCEPTAGASVGDGDDGDGAVDPQGRDGVVALANPQQLPVSGDRFDGKPALWLTVRRCVPTAQPEGAVGAGVHNPETDALVVVDADDPGSWRRRLRRPTPSENPSS